MVGGTRLCDVCLIVRDVIEEVERQAGLSFPIHVRGSILPVVSSRLAIEGSPFVVHLSRRDWRSDQFYSALFRYRDHAQIIYSADLNRCWKRFAVCKEAAHLLIDDEGKHFTSNVVVLIQRLITFAPMMEVDALIESEMMGVVAAVEMLLPWKLRPQLVAMRDSGRSDLEIAEHARVPEKFANLMLRSPYADLSARVNGQLDGPK